MSGLDFIDNSATGYAFVWHNRPIIIRQALPVLGVKLICLIFILSTFNVPHPLREGIYRLPGDIIEAFFIAHLIRLYMFQEPMSIFPLSREIFAPSNTNHPNRRTAIHSCVAIYLLTKTILMILIGLMAVKIPTGDREFLGEPTLLKAIASLCFLALMFWSIRLLWLFMPRAAGIPVSVFLERITGIGNSLYFLGVFAMCFLPMMLIYTISDNILSGILGSGNLLQLIASAALQTFILLISLCIQVIAISAGIRVLFHEGRNV